MRNFLFTPLLFTSSNSSTKASNALLEEIVLGELMIKVFGFKWIKGKDFMVKVLGFALLMIGSVLAHSVQAQSLTEQLEQGLKLSPKPSETSPQSPTDASPQNLSEQIESLKQAMINLNRDLFILEEDLLFPSSTQVAVYLSMDVGEYFGLDAVEIRINGEVKTYYLYTSRQVNALYRGGVQRLFVGNVNQGEHQLTAYFVGIGPQNREYKRAVSIEFKKDKDPVAIELSVIDSTAKQQPTFSAREL